MKEYAKLAFHGGIMTDTKRLARSLFGLDVEGMTITFTVRKSVQSLATESRVSKLAI